MTKNNEAGWNFDNSYAKLPNVFFSHLNPTPVRDPGLVILNEKLAKTLGLNLAELKSENGLAVFAGNDIPDTATPIAQAYAGHQFGHFNMLGDGRAILLGEHLTPNGDRVDIQLKGPGRTPYSRGGDGRAALGPMLREYIISEAMYALGIPTTRSLAVVTTGESIFRDRILPGAILTRVAASHIRVGTFEFAAKWTSKEDLQSLADYTMKRHFPEVRVKDYLGFLQAVVKRQADLIAKWQLVGFIHGVMNTDNMVISGETIDYGPCAFMDTYDPGTVFSSIDRQGRYAYINQPYKARWNLTRFAEALMPLLHEKMEESMELVKEVLSTFNVIYEENWLTGMRAKLGLFGKEEEDRALIDDLLLLMENYQADYTNTFCAFTLDKLTNSPLFEAQDFIEWYARWQSRLQKQHQTKEESQQLMRKVNPAVIPRNHLVEEALEAAEARNDDRVLHKLLEILANPYAYSKEQEEYSKVPVSSTPYQTFCGT